MPCAPYYCAQAHDLRMFLLDTRLINQNVDLYGALIELMYGLCNTVGPDGRDIIRLQTLIVWIFIISWI